VVAQHAYASCLFAPPFFNHGAMWLLKGMVCFRIGGWNAHKVKEKQSSFMGNQAPLWFTAMEVLVDGTY
jgi:hypothetical protein